MADPFWKSSEKIQRALWKVDEDTLDKVWLEADAQLKPNFDGVWDGHDLTEEGKMCFELGQLVAESHPNYKPRDTWGFDTGANYMALFVGTEEEVAQRLKKCGVAI